MENELWEANYFSGLLDQFVDFSLACKFRAAEGALPNFRVAKFTLLLDHTADIAGMSILYSAVAQV